MSPRALRAPPLWLVPASSPPAAACCPVCSPQPVAETAVGQAFATFLRLEVAQGAATADTQRGYWSQVRAWAAWCQAQACCLATASATAVKTYRQQLVEAEYQPASIAHKLAVLRRLYAAAIAQGLRVDNPALGVHPPRDRRAAELLPCLAEGELVCLLQAVPRTDTVSTLRDRALLALLALQGLRTVEITRANVEDLYSGEPVVLRVRGKTRDRLLPLRPDLTAVLQAYLAARGGAYSTEFCHPVRRKVATQSTAKLPRNPQESCHPVHGNSATQCTTALPLSERSDAGVVHD